jgi:hypothetical protein
MAKTVPIEVTDSRAAVTTYYAILAYPDVAQLARRRIFRKALQDTWVKAFSRIMGRKIVPSSYTFLKNERIYSTLQLGIHRIVRRLGAGTIGWSLVMHGDWQASEHSVQVTVPGSRTLDQALRSYIGKRRSEQETETALKNANHRIWGQSLSVLHLAMKNPVVLKIVENRLNREVMENPGPVDVFEDLVNSFYDPHWLLDSLRGAEELRLTLGDQLGSNPQDPLRRGFWPDRAIRLIPLRLSATE